MARANAKPDWVGPTAERIIQSDGYIVIGDDQMGGKVYTFLDSSLDRIYSHMTKTSRYPQEQLRAEYAALCRFYRAYVASGMIGSVGSIDMDGSGGSGRRSFLAATEAQVNARNEYVAATGRLNHHEGIVVQNVVCNDLSLELAGFAVGRESRTSAITSARDLLRESGSKLANLWGIGR